MKKFFQHLFKIPAAEQALVLMYHRIGEAQSDVWDIAVSPENFEAQLQVLKKRGNVISLPELVAGIHQKKIKPNCIALTFDDGYADNFLRAKPLLEYYQIPATFFICSVNLEQHREFWWDELEYLLLFAEPLPSSFSLSIRDKLIEHQLGPEVFLSEKLKQIHSHWKAFVQAPPTSRAQIFFEVWSHLRPLPYAEQQEYLQKIRVWAGIPTTVREEYKSMSVAQLQKLAGSAVCSIGVHTAHHVALAAHSRDFQKAELEANRWFLEEKIKSGINLLAYPYGNYNEDTFYAAAGLHFYAGFTTQAKPIQLHDHPYGLGRFQVKNLNGPEFQQQLSTWEGNAK